MSMGLSLESIARVTVGAASAAAPTVGPVLTSGITEPYIGAAVNVVIAVCAGAIAGVAFVEGKETRKQLFKLALGSVIIGSALTTLLVEVFRHKLGWDLEAKHVSSIGVIVGALMRFTLPPIIVRIPKWLDSIRIPFFSKSKSNNEGE